MANLLKNVNSLRLLRLQLKSGYIKFPPPEYLFLQRYPPVSRTSLLPVEKVLENREPLPELYDKAIARNALYADERVYPAYWQQDPTAFSLAKRQYQLMKQGLDEEAAYVQALRYVEELESNAYEKGKILENILKEKGAQVVYASDDSLMQDITHWRARLAETRYSNMTLGDQGQVDHLIQTRILKWQEVERERRMSDPIFYQQFISVRTSIFPEIASEMSMKRFDVLNRARKDFKSDIYKKYSLNEQNLSPASPFYLEDYAYYFKKVKENPSLTLWNENDRSTFFRWIVNTLAFREVLKNSASIRVQSYLEDVRNKFFPMIKYPEKAENYQVPSINDLKAILYQNDIGYKKQNEKYYVRRFYRLPGLLFPEETAEPVPSYRMDQTAPYSPRAHNKSVEEIRRELEPKASPLQNKRLSLDDLLQDDDSSEDDLITGITPTKLPSKVEQLLKDLDLSSDESETEKETPSADNFSLSSFNPEEKIQISLTPEQRDVLSSNSDLKDLLSLFDLVDVPEEETRRNKCRELLKGLRREVQHEVIQTILGKPLVEEVNPEEFYPFLIEKMPPNKLKRLYQMLKEVNILGRVSTEEERNLLKERYNPTDKTVLELEREEFLQRTTRTSYDYCVTEQEYEQVYTARQQFLVMEKAQMGVQFEQREAARQTLDWEMRGVFPPNERRFSSATLLTNQKKLSSKKPR